MPGALLPDDPSTDAPADWYSQEELDVFRLSPGRRESASRSVPRFHTADFRDTAPGNLRADYVLPRKNLRVVGAGVFWPLLADPAIPADGGLSVPELRSPAGVVGPESPRLSERFRRSTW
jgi:hypothetical protein